MCIRDSFSAVQFLKGEDRQLDRHMVLGRDEAVFISLFRDALAEDGVGSQSHNRYAGNFADVGYGTGRPGIDFDDINLVVDVYKRQEAMRSLRMGLRL